MSNIKNISLIILSIFILTGCGLTTSQIKKVEMYPHMYDTNANSILVLPAKNTTTSVDATNHFRYTISKPLSEKGYYVLPVHLVDAFFKSENLVETQMIRDIPISKLKEIFNPDAILYVDINTWDTSYMVFTSYVDVGVTFSLVDASSGKELWSNNSYAYSYSGLDTNNGLVGLLVSAITAAINTGVDYTELSNVANTNGASRLPYGKYHPLYRKDMNDIYEFFDYAKLKDGKLYVHPYIAEKNHSKDEDQQLSVILRKKGYHSFSVDTLSSVRKDAGAFEMFVHNGYQKYYLN